MQRSIKDKACLIMTKAFRIISPLIKDNSTNDETSFIRAIDEPGSRERTEVHVISDRVGISEGFLRCP